ncbi:DUF748 domain-containing protein [Maribellus mangrovi]|uniref:DUF748 domain-containing protein n=1 Tax=Maribellus mangrovi TaxID=3133146 RepID=UPI0030EB4C43
MKRVITIVLIIVVILIAAVVAIPVFFKQNMLDYARNTLNKQLNAQVEVADLKLSLFRSFPKVSLQLEGVVISGKGTFENDTLVQLRSLRTSTTLKSVLHPSNMAIEEIVVDNARVNLLVAENGEVNWDIEKPKSKTKENNKPDSAEEDDFHLQLDKIEIRNVSMVYDDQMTNMKLTLDDIDFDVSGEMFGASTQLKTKGGINELSLSYDDVNYISKTKLSTTTLLNVNFETMTFTIGENELLINRLPLQLTGNISMPNDSIQFDLGIQTNSSDFENFLALVPPVYESYLKEITTSGSATINGIVKGFYFQDSYPAFNLNASIDKGNFQYAEMPEEIKNIRAKVNIVKPQGDLDLTEIKVDDTHAEIRNNPVDLIIKLTQPVSDPYFDAAFVGKINLTHLKNALPLDSVNMSGIIDANIMAKGRYSAIEKEAYEKIQTDGAVLLNDFVYQSAGLTKEIQVPQGQMNFTPKQINLSKFQMLIGASDFNLSGAVSDYLSYLFSEGTLNGNLQLNSQHANLNELLRLQVSDDKTPEKTDEEVLAFSVPPRINFRLRSNIKTALINRITIRDINGLIVAANEKLTLENLDMDMLQGQLKMNGSYQNTSNNQPIFDFGFDISKIDIPTIYNTLAGIQKMMPMTGNSSGKISSDLGIKGRLNPQLGLIASSINGKGTFSTSNLEIMNSPVFNQLSGILKKEKLRDIKVDDFMAHINIENGNLLLKPFTTKVIGQETTVEGRLNTESLIDMKLDFLVQRDAFGPDIQKVLGVIPGNEKIKILPARVNISGPVGDPQVKPDLSVTTKAVADATKDDVKNSLDKLGKGILKLFEK